MEKILLDFGIEDYTKINNGPEKSLYEFEPAPGVKVAKIINLSDDLARNTSSTSARVSIPGKNTIKIELPNENRDEVLLREIISNEKFQRKDIRLPIALSKKYLRFANNWRSNFYATLVNSWYYWIWKISLHKYYNYSTLLYKLSPEHCKLILIDPKMLELYQLMRTYLIF